MPRVHIKQPLVLISASIALAVLLSLSTTTAKGQPVINEIMYAPVSPEPEWIEIFNPDSTPRDISSWNIRAGTRHAALPSLILAPGEYLVLTKDSAALWTKRPGSYPILQVSLPSLRNSGDSLMLRDASGGTIDSLYYLPSWGGAGGSSLERKAAKRSSTLASNWGTPLVMSGATPGARNSIAIPDFDLALDSLNYRFFSDTLFISVRITNRGLSTSDSSMLTLDIDSGRGNQVLLKRSIKPLTSDSSLMSLSVLAIQTHHAATYTLTITMPLDTTHGNDTLRFTSQLSAAPLSIVMNEIMFAPVKPEPEWIELLNTSSDTIDIGGWQFTVGHGSPCTLPENSAGRVPPDSMLVITASDSTLAAIRHVPRRKILSAPLPTLSNTGAMIAFRNPRGNVIDTVSYDGAWIKADGTSIERIDAFRPGYDPANWKACEDTNRCTILAPNSVRIRNYDLELLNFALTDSSIEVTLVNAGRDTVRKTSIAMVGIDTVIQSISGILSTRDSLRVAIPYPRDFYGVDSVAVFVLDSLDRQHNNDSLHFSIAAPVPHDSLVINEIMFKPQAGSCEWIELYNATARKVAMVGSALLAGSKKLSSFVCPPFVIPPFFYGLLAADTAIASVYPAIADRSKIGVLGRTSLDLSNDSASIVLRNTNESTIDSVRYYKSWQTSLRPDLTGISLERIHWYGPSNEASNWQSSNDARGATPLAANSTTLGSTPPSQNVAFNASFDPNPFSPDGDGFEDIATLTITSGDANQYAVRVRVFDNNGRVVRTLADAATMTGSLPLYFDGKRDNGQTLVPGLYTVLVELSSQNSTSLRKTIGIGIAGKRR